MINMTGRTVLAKASLSNIPSHVMQFIKLPQKTIEAIDKIEQDFIQVSSANRKKIHLLSWDILTKTKPLGGLGMYKVEHRNRALHSSIAWRLLKNPNQLWAKVLTTKYQRETRTIQGTKVVSKTWRNLRTGWKDYANGMAWSIHNRHKTNFLIDSWIPHTNPLRSLICGPLQKNKENLKVYQVVTNGVWDLTNLSLTLPLSITDLINNTPLLFKGLRERTTLTGSPLKMGSSPLLLPIASLPTQTTRPRIITIPSSRTFERLIL